ncbi:hypothetical protein Afe04nite_65750 [Asanoa ferruginea]|nr:hypothetical protein Afe04nite_65750 [Asanoa ferruginea]
MRERVAREQERRAQVDRLHLVPQVHVDRRRRAALADARDQGDHVDPAQRPRALGHQPARDRRVGEVPDRVGIGAQAAQAPLVAVGREDAMTRGGQRDGRCPADPRGRPGHQCDRAVQLLPQSFLNWAW